MIELQTAILIAGIIVFVVVLVVSYDRYRSGQKDELESQDGVEAGDSLLHPRKSPRSKVFDRQPVLSPDSKLRHEPKFETETSTGAETEPMVEEGLNIGAHPTGQQEDLFTGDSGHQEREQEDEDKLPLELVARIPGSNVINRDTALGIYRQFEFEIKKKSRIFGLSHPDRNWRDLEKQPESAQFSDFGVSVQLADRSGPITESELNHFSQMILRFAEVLGRRFKFSISLNDALGYARQLDEFCKNYDAVAILNVVARNQGFRGSDIHKCTRELGLQLNKRSIYEKRHPSVQAGRLCYSMASLTRDGKLPAPGSEDYVTGGLTLFMNIPRTENPTQIFADMVADAKVLCKQLNGTLVDHNLRGMTQKGLKKISQQIRRIVHEMEQTGVTPGSGKTLRLF